MRLLAQIQIRFSLARLFGVTLALVLMVLASVITYAAPLTGEEPTIGPELSFESPHTRASFDARVKRHRWLNALTRGFWKKHTRKPESPTVDGEHLDAVALKNIIMSRCKGCRLSTSKEKYGLETFQILFPNGYWIVIGVDEGRVELQTKHLPLDEYEQLSDFIQENVYAAAADVDLFPVLDTDGHTNIGILSAFKTTDQFAEFFLDQFNHPELGMGVLGKDYNNAPPLILQEQKQLEALYSVMNEVKAGQIRTHKEFAQNINKRVYYRSLEKETLHEGEHYQAFSIKRALRDLFPIFDAPFEIRTTAGRETFRLVLLNYRLFVKRIEFLKKRTEFSNLRRDFDVAKTKTMTPSEMLSRFYIFVTEMNEDFNEYRALIYRPEVKEASLDAFAAGVMGNSPGQTQTELLRYVEDLEISQWVRDQMKKILGNPAFDEVIRLSLLRAIEVRMGNPSLRTENKAVLAAYYEDLRPEREELARIVAVRRAQRESQRGGAVCPAALGAI